jgi:hypothetical protein
VGRTEEVVQEIELGADVGFLVFYWVSDVVKQVLGLCFGSNVETCKSLPFRSPQKGRCIED